MNNLSPELGTLVGRLVAIHGEAGLSPTRADWTEILMCPGDKPVHILNLLKFKQEVNTPAGPRHGMVAYGSYAAGVGTAFARVGGKTLYFGKVDHIFGTIAGTDWDAAILTRYPTPRSLAEFWLDEEFLVAHAHRVDGIEQSRVFVMSAIREA